MARLPRFVIPGQPQHIIQRGNNRQAIFRAEADYSFFLEKLAGSNQGVRLVDFLLNPASLVLSFR